MQTRLKQSLQNCGICLEKVTLRGQIDSCSHIFCLQCIKNWAEIQNTCPMCKMRFTTIQEQLMRKNYSLSKNKKKILINIEDRSQKEATMAQLTQLFSIEDFTIALIEIMEMDPELIQEFISLERDEM